MISEPEILIECDSDVCSANLYLQPEYVYRDWSGKNGYYDCEDTVIEERIIKDGWSCSEGKHYCEDCTEDMTND